MLGGGGGGGGGTHGAGAAPSVDGAEAQPKLAVGGWTHAHIAGQSLAALHVIILASQCDVLSAVHPQVGGETPESSPGAGEGAELGGVDPPPLLAVPASPGGVA
jgi:hypothetical protein